MNFALYAGIIMLGIGLVIVAAFVATAFLDGGKRPSAPDWITGEERDE